MYTLFNGKKYTFTENPHFEYHDSIGCMSPVNSDEWVTVSATDDSSKSYELWWKCPKGLEADSVLNREPDDIIDENGKYIK